MKRFSTLLLIALTLFASCKNRDFKDYIEQGFSKPSVEDVHFNISNKGSENKIYVPSAQEIEVEFTIKNRYEKELEGEVSFNESASNLFNAPPHIKELTPKKMVIAFNFKAEGEPSSQNAFLGVSVPISLKIFDKKTGHFLSSQNITANCNTPPLPVLESDITYVEGRDEKYIVKLPKIDGIHKDLKEVKFFLSSAYGNENVKPKTVSIDDATQDTLHTLIIKGDEDWQLQNPSGDRKIKTIVYDKAGLKSGEGLKNASRIFTSITLEPSSIELSLEKILENGVPVPEIKELKEFFNGDDWKKAGYTIKYENSNFSYDETAGKLKQKGTLSVGEHDVVVTLEHGGNQPNAIYKIKTKLDVSPSINQSKLKITDETEYKELIPPNGAKSLELSGESIVFQDVGDVKEGTLEVPYTGFKTNLKVHLEANSNYQKIKLGAEEKEVLDAELTLEKDSGNSTDLNFFVTTLASNVQKEYKITFTRGASVTANVSCAAELLQSNCKVIMSWKYAKQEVKVKKDLTGISSGNFKVAKGEKVKFEITAGKGNRIKSCSSNQHPQNDIDSQIDVNNDKEMSFELTADENFSLSVTFRAEASFNWVGIGGENSKGYQRAHVSYHLNNATHNEKYGITTPPTPPPTPEKAIEKGSECKFWIEGLDQKYIVTKWEVNGDEIKQDGGDFKVSNDLISLTIDYPDKDYVVKVFTTELCNLELKVCNSGGTEITDHNYTFEVRKDLSNEGLIPQSPANHCEGIMAGTKLYITAKEGTKVDYEIEKWEKSEDGGPFTYLPLDGGKDKTNFNITKDTIVRLVLKKKMYNLKVKFDRPDFDYTLKATDITASSSVTNITLSRISDGYSCEVVHGTKVKLKANKATQDIKYGAIKHWEIKKDSESAFSKITGSDGKDEIEVTIEKNTDIKIILIPQYIFKITRLSSAASGKLKITSGDTSSTATLLKEITDEFEHEILATGKNIYFEVLDVNKNNNSEKVVDCKVNNGRVGDYLGEDGFWNLERQKLTLSPGNKFEVVIAPVQRINLKVTEGSALYNNNNYELIVKQSDADKTVPNHVMLPIANWISIKHSLLRKTEYADGYPIYITEGTQLDFRMDDLPTDKEIGEWLKDAVALGGEFNDSHNDPYLRIGRNKIEGYNACPNNPSSTPTSITAKIRDKTKLLSFSIEDYKNKGKIGDAKIKLHVNYSGSDSNAEIFTISGSEDIPKNCRIEETKTIKLEIEEETVHEYYFAEWEGDSSENRFNKIKTVSLGSEVSTIRALCTKNVIVMVHPPMPSDKGNSNFPGEYFPNPDNEWHGFGVVRIGKKNEIESSSSANEIDCKEVGIQYTNVLISQFNTANGGELAVKFVKDTLVYNGANVFWRYSFGGDGKNPQYDSYDNNPFGHEGIKFSARPGKILEFKNPPKCAFVHIWLRKVQVYSGP